MTGARDVAIPSYADRGALRDALQGVGCVVHLAARAHQTAGFGDEVARFHEANVEATMSVADAAMAERVPRVVLVSSIGVNGNRTRGRPFTDRDPAQPVELYAVSKWSAEQALRSRLAGSATAFVILRPPLVYGPGCPGNFGRLVQLVAKAPCVPLGGLHAPRTFIGIHNLVDALLTAAVHERVAGQTHLVADARDVSVAEVVHTLAAVLRPGRRVVFDVPAGLLHAAARLARQTAAWEKLAAPLQVDACGFRAATGWTAEIDPAEGLRETARQFRIASIER